jgi:hypothetical protein
MTGRQKAKGKRQRAKGNSEGACLFLPFEFCLLSFAFRPPGGAA